MRRRTGHEGITIKPRLFLGDSPHARDHSFNIDIREGYHSFKLGERISEVTCVSPEPHFLSSSMRTGRERSGAPYMTRTMVQWREEVDEFPEIPLVAKHQPIYQPSAFLSHSLSLSRSLCYTNVANSHKHTHCVVFTTKAKGPQIMLCTRDSRPYLLAYLMSVGALACYGQVWTCT